MKLVNIEIKIFVSSERYEELLGNFQERRGLMITLKLTKRQGFTISLENTFLEKPYGGDVKLTLQLFWD